MSRYQRLTGKQALFEQLLADDVTCIFGNPGTTEQGFMDALLDYPQITYYLALHEGVAIGMADAYGRGTGQPAFVEMHIAPGLGNAMGTIYNAWAGRSPMVVYAGQSPSEALFQEPYLWGDLVSLARPFSKWAAEIGQTADVPQALRRAFKVAEEPPQGPVILSIPMDTLDREADVVIAPTTFVPKRVPPPVDELDRAAALLARAERPAIAIGDHVGLAAGQEGVVALAELLGAPLLNALSTGVNAPAGHPLYQPRGGAPLRSSAVRRLLEGYDVVLAVGTPVFPSILPDPRGPIPEDTKVIHVDYDSWELAKNQPGHLIMRADPALTVEAIRQQLEGQDEGARAGWQERRETIERVTTARREEQREQHRASWDQVPIAPHRLMAELAAAIPEEAAIFDESITSGRALELYLEPAAPWRRYRSRGGGIGTGLPGALGLQVAFPDRPVVGIVSDGAAHMSITALWTAAHYRLPVTYIICNNRGYRVLKRNLEEYRGGGALARGFPHMDLIDPEPRLDLIAEGYGVATRRIEHPGDLTAALKEALESDGPFLLDVVVDGSL